jgi:hypothetical protein
MARDRYNQENQAEKEFEELLKYLMQLKKLLKMQKLI